MAIGSSFLLVVVLLLSVTLCVADSKGVRLTLHSITDPHGRRSLPTYFDRKQTLRDVDSRLTVSKLPAPASTGYLGWETLQLDVALGTPGKCVAVCYGHIDSVMGVVEPVL